VPKNSRKKPLAARVTPGGVLVVEIGIEALAHATKHDLMRHTQAEVVDPRAFARAVAIELMNEDGEDGSSPATRMLDRAIESVVESGESCVRLPSDEEDRS
jgi:hypothetical protein